MSATSPVSVVHIITQLELGGAQQNTLFTISHLDSTRFRSVLITGEPGLLDEEAKALPGIDFYQIPTLRRSIRPIADGHALFKLTKLLARIKPAIVHTHSSKAGIVGRFAARMAHVPIIVHSIHGFGFTPAQYPLLRRILIAIERRAGRITSRFFAVSEANRRTGISLGIFPAERCSVIRSGVDLRALRRTDVNVAGKKRQLGLDSDRPTIGMVAPFKPQKAPLDFVHLAAVVHRQSPSAQFVMIGDGDMRPAVKQEIDRHGLASSMHLLGWRRDIPEILRCLNVLVLTSRWEGLPRVYLEALASGVPVVGTRVDGAPEVIRDGINGYLLEPGDVAGLADRVLYLLTHPADATRMGRNAQSVPPEFDIHEMVRRQEREYERLIVEWQHTIVRHDRWPSTTVPI
ncbi:MAG TPA: glycosyltransferase family 4 protein [Nitrospiraceae bacterium]|nr:glycosyltransferase family 4 protein [Nitrospiraceae bacterium]